MKKFIIGLLAAATLAGGLAAEAKTSSTDNHTSRSPYRTIMDKKMPGCSVIRPADLDLAFSMEGRLPLVLFLSDGHDDSEGFLADIASQGYVVMKADAETLSEALDRMGGKRSEYRGKVDTERCAAMVQGYGTIAELSEDPRVRTVISIDRESEATASETTPAQPCKPVLCIAGSGSRASAAQYFRNIEGVPAAAAIFREGECDMAGMALLWLDWQLKGREDNEVVFRYSQIPPHLEGWSLVSRNFNHPFVLPLLEERPSENTEAASFNDMGEIVNYRAVNDPDITVCLPDADKADGSAVVIFPGGSLVSLTWDSEFRKIADWLNARGVAAIGVKYRLRTSFERRARPAPDPGNKFQSMRAEIFDFTELRKANTNPAGAGAGDPATELAAEDAVKAMRIIRENASDWNIDPDRIGWMGFSAGGAVALAALMKAGDELMPSFLCSVYGPSSVDVTVPENAPKLYIAVHADHPNVAAGCMALFMEWKKAGIDSEIHVYGTHTGGFYGGGKNPLQHGYTPEGYWLESFYSWMVANGFAR